MISLIGVTQDGTSDTTYVFPEDYGQDLAEIASKLAVVRYITVACMAWLIWDSFVLLPDESNKIWSGKWSFPKVIFILKRYSSIVALIWKCLEHFYSFSDPLCKQFIVWEFWCGLGLCALVEVTFIMQLAALYDRSRKVILGLGLFFAVQMASMSTFLGIGLDNIMPLQRPGEWFTGCYPKTYPTLLWGFWIPVLVFEAFALFLAITKSSYNACNRAQPRQLSECILDGFTRDGVFYMSVVLGTVFVSTIFWITSCTLLAPIMVPPMIALSSICGCRIILNFPCLTWPPDKAGHSLPPSDYPMTGKDRDLELNEVSSVTLSDGKGIMHTLPTLGSCVGKRDPSPSRCPAAPFARMGEIDLAESHQPALAPLISRSSQEDNADIQPSAPPLTLPAPSYSAITRTDSLQEKAADPHRETRRREAPSASWFDPVIEPPRPATTLGHDTRVESEEEDCSIWDAADIEDGLDRPRRTHQRRWKSDDMAELTGAPLGQPSFTPGFRTVTHPAPPTPEPTFSRFNPRSRRLARFRNSHQSSSSEPRLSQDSMSSSSSATHNHPLHALPHSRSRLSLFLHRNRGEATLQNSNINDISEDGRTPASMVEGETDIHTPLTRTPSRFSATSRSSGRFRRMVHSSISSRYGSPSWSPGGRARARESDALTIDTVSTDWPIFDVDPRLISDTPDMA